MRYFLDISYRGTAFHGWQIQPNAHTVQEEINRALSIILQQDISCLGSGRTDTGVHALQQIAHFDAELSDTLDQLQYRLNGLLPAEVSINSIRPVKPEAHARFDAVRRTYHYHLHRQKDPFKTGVSYFFSRSLEAAPIQEAIGLMKNWKNFQAFSKVHTDVNHFDCDIYEINWQETNEGYVFSVSANRFLRGMIRAMVGTLLEVGQGRLNQTDLKNILESGERSRAGRAVPAEGLFLTEVKYPESIYLDI
ncbi:tRNA pseudouridine(38-40) synthase TruA [Marinoscillum sp. 108]|uniref:tRNA pseudouridine(38-40) synthase TruA n=1 Tax=Marinoscillum sp. 108 TaxID=2653151 RepID=UPI0012F007D0|nr:tRNA pseudouridine(38-40) synthase TruA [Marinoscillum sp. 108]VXD20804.1 tRNA pseudouridine synthase A [Marinoscillum sp. 108]